MTVKHRRDDDGNLVHDTAACGRTMTLAADGHDETGDPIEGWWCEPCDTVVWTGGIEAAQETLW